MVSTIMFPPWSQTFNFLLETEHIQAINIFELYYVTATVNLEQSHT